MNDSAAETERLARMIRKARWYRNRLRAMSVPEIAHRLNEQRKRTVSRIATPRRVLDYTHPDSRLPVWPGLAEGVGALARDSQLLAGWSRHATAVGAGCFRFLGIDWPATGAVPDWHLDPVTGRRWPDDSYCFDIAYRHADELGDVKNVWELSRLQYLQPLAAYAVVAEDPEAAATCRRHLMSWIERNPPWNGVHWSSGIEVAFRIVSILLVTGLLGAGFGAGERTRIIRCLYQHGWWLDRFPSRYSSANNHLVAEAAALFILGTLMPDLPGAPRWARYGRTTLERQALRQIHPDGVGAEQSPAYLALTLEWLLLADALGHATGSPFSGTCRERVAAAGQFLKWITDAGGNQPRIGDDDDSHVIGNGMEPEATINSILAALAHATGQPGCAPPVAVRHLRHALLPAAPPDRTWPSGFRHFADGGYTVCRQPAGALPDHMLVFDHGPLGYLSIAAHGHADSLAIWMHVDGRPLLIDAGTYLYHAGGTWRDHFRGTVAHNTLTLAGENSSEISGPFNWARKARARAVAVDSRADRKIVTAEHDGYLESAKVRHVRSVQCPADGRFRIEDSLAGPPGRHRVEIGFLVDPRFVVEAAGQGFVVRDDRAVVLRISHDGPLAGWVETGRLAPERGWHSPAFGVRAPAPRLVFAGEMAVGRPAAFELLVSPRGP